MGKRSYGLIGWLMLLSIVAGCGRAESPQPTAPPVPGWEKFEGGRVELWLPQSYTGGDLSGEHRVDDIHQEVDPCHCGGTDREGLLPGVSP